MSMRRFIQRCSMETAMSTSAIHAITNEDVIEFRRSLEEDSKTLTPMKARQRLIESGVLDKDGKPRWPSKKSSNN